MPQIEITVSFETEVPKREIDLLIYSIVCNINKSPLLHSAQLVEKIIKED